jgi:hypothetical protein
MTTSSHEPEGEDEPGDDALQDDGTMPEHLGRPAPRGCGGRRVPSRRSELADTVIAGNGITVCARTCRATYCRRPPT